jgi:UDP-glucose 4-epimerase
MNILVTGGAGYIGSVAIERLIVLGYKVFCVDNLSNGRLKAVELSCKFYNGNFGDFDLLDQIFSSNKIDIVFHFAGEANVPDSIINPSKYYSTNIIHSINLLDKMVEYGINKIVFSSSASVYGNPLYSPIDELHPLEPINPYGYTKLVFENILKDYSKAYGLKHISFRYFCAAGATKTHGESRDYETHLMPTVIDHILGKTDEISIFGSDFDTIDGSGVRDYVHVEDIVDAHIIAIKKINQFNGNVYNIGNSSGFSVHEIIKEAENIFSKKAKIKVKNRRKGDPAILVAKCELIEKDFSWTPKKTLSEMLITSFDWRNNPSY